MSTLPYKEPQSLAIPIDTPEVEVSTAMAKSLSITAERIYLNGIGEEANPFSLTVRPTSRLAPPEPYWVRIEQIGRPVDGAPEKCFSAMQKILQNCHMPGVGQLLFLLKGRKGVFEMYLGIRPYDSGKLDDDFTAALGNFIQGLWPGSRCTEASRTDVSVYSDFEKSKGGNMRVAGAMTGIPSMASEYGDLYPATLDTLISGMRQTDFTYLVVADPVAESEIDQVLTTCRDYAGRAESMKTIQFSQSMAESWNKTVTKGRTETNGTNESTSKKNPLYGIAGIGLVVAGTLFPPAALLSSILVAGHEIAGTNLLGDFAPTKTKGKSHSISENISTSDTQGGSKTQTINRTIVDRHVGAIAEKLANHEKRFETGRAIGCWRVGAYMATQYESDLQVASSQLKSIVSGSESIYEPIRMHRIDRLPNMSLPATIGNFLNPSIDITAAGETFHNPFGKTFDGLRTMLTTKELSYLINFPLHSVPGINVIESTPEFSITQPRISGEDSIAIGKLLYGGSPTQLDYEIDASSLSRHALVCGINGSGKTNTILSLLASLSAKMPFLVIEPAKTEYVDWALEYNDLHKDKPINIFMPGCRVYRHPVTGKDVRFPELKLNPFEIIWLEPGREPSAMAHIDRLKSVFTAAFPMYDILPVLLEDLIYTVYQSPTTDWLNSDPVYGKTLFPTLNGMSINVDKVINAHKYEERIERNMKACLNTRIDSLMRGWKGKMLNTLHSTSWDSLFDRPTVVNLSYLGDDSDKCFFMSLLLLFLYEYRMARADAGHGFTTNCGHVTVVEEAHRVMSKCDNPEMAQYRSSMMFANMLSEIRAYGEGLILVDQVPTRLVPDAVKNTNMKIVHRLVSRDDCEEMAGSMGLNETQGRIIPHLLTGQALISTALSSDKHWVAVNKMKK